MPSAKPAWAQPEQDRHLCPTAAMPVMLMTAADIERWPSGSVEEALELLKPAPDAEFVVRKGQVAA